jgi:hypothetical protein
MPNINYTSPETFVVPTSAGSKVFPATKAGKLAALKLHSALKVEGKLELSRTCTVRLMKVGPPIKSEGVKGTVFHQVGILDEDNKTIQANMWRSNVDHKASPWAGTPTADLVDWFENNGYPTLVARVTLGKSGNNRTTSMWVSHLTPGNGLLADFSSELLDELDQVTLDETVKVDAEEIAALMSGSF